MKIEKNVSAVITGAASGLGEATARALAAEGARVAIFDLDEHRGRDVADDIGGIYCQVDVTDQQSVEAGFEAARLAHGQERIMINCAGISPSERLIWRDRTNEEIRSFDINVFHKSVAINLTGTFRCCLLAMTGMASLEPTTPGGEKGVIINTGSIAAEDGQGRSVGYAASKAGVVGLTLAMARGMAAESIRINTINPGLMETAIMANVPPEFVKQVTESIPFPRRLGNPEEFADLALFLIRNGYMNGETIRIDGAIRLPP